MRIGEVSELSGVSVRMLRHYDRTGLLTPSHCTSAGYRDYTPADLDRLLRVEALRSLGLSLAEVRDALTDPDMSAASVLDDIRARTLLRIRAERELLDRLDEVRAATPTDWKDALDVTALLTALREGPSRRRQAAVIQSPDRQPVAALVASYLEEPDDNAAGALRWSLLRSGEAAVPGLLCHLLERIGGDPVTDRRIIDLLDGSDAPAATAALEDVLLMSDTDENICPDTAARVATALARRGIRPEKVIDTLVGMVRDGIRDTEAADALAGVVRDDPGACSTVIGKLLTTAEDSGIPARLRIVQAFGDIPGAGAREALERFAGDEDTTVAGTAHYLLGR